MYIWKKVILHYTFIIVFECYNPDFLICSNDIKKHLFLGNYDKFPGPDKNLIKFSLCRKYLSVADESAVWLWDCEKLIALIELNSCVSSKFILYFMNYGKSILLTLSDRVIPTGITNFITPRLL